jgi:hypothetical protein
MRTKVSASTVRTMKCLSSKRLFTLIVSYTSLYVSNKLYNVL